MTDGHIRLLRILVPVDGSDVSRFAAEQAIRAAQAYAAELIFLHVIDDRVVAELAQETDHERAESMREPLRETGRTYLHDAARLAEDGRVAHRELIAEGDPCAVICDTANAEEVDLIVMGKIGSRGARRILMGSVARRVIESTDKPVLVVGHRPPA